MVLLILFAFLAGAATAVSPCVLPVLPVALSAGMTGGRRRPLGVVSGLALSFTFATVALVYVIAALKLPDGLLRTLAIVTLIAFGCSLLVPAVADRLEARLSRITGGVRSSGEPSGGALSASDGHEGTRRGQQGFWSGLLVGGGLGFVYAPCAGPILAGVITVSASQMLSAERLSVALAYGVGSAAALYVLMLGGRRLTGRLSRRSGRFQMAMGAVMVLVALLMLGNYDTRFETAIASDLPSFLVDPSKGLESSSAATRQLAALSGHHVRKAAGLKQADAGLSLPVLGRAPEFTETQRWLNTPGGQPLTLAELRGHVVLVDFWTYTCINCIRTLPYLNAWYAKYRSDGFEIVGVHTPEFPFEHSAANVAAAISQNGIRYPVVQDNNQGTWNAYQNQYWPAEYLIDAQGRIRLADFGEGEYGVKERAIRSLLTESGVRLGSPARVHALAAPEAEVTPESYLGAERAERFTNGQIEPGVHDFGPLGSEPLPLSALRYGGVWNISAWSATAVRNAALQLHFTSQRVYLVMGASHTTATSVLLDGHPIPARLAGSDVQDGLAHVGPDRLYRLVNLPSVQTHTLTVEAPSGLSVYDFTFG
jgi:cytochrome c biogenesis protein CcdA/thiol-disulfide isomerase/thioredoxin